MGIVTILYLVLWSVMIYYFQNTTTTHGMGDQFKPYATLMISQMGFQFSAMLMALLTIMLGAGAISSEIETGLIHGILARPIHRFEYILGKFAGLVIMASIYATVLYSLLLCIGSLFGLSTISSLTLSQIMLGWLLYLLIPIAVLCLTLFGSVSLKTVPNGILMIFIYILGNVGGMVEMIGRFINNTAVSGVGIFISLLSPFHTIYNTMERTLLPSTGISNMAMGGPLSGSGAPASVWMYLYIGIYMIGFVLLAIRKFSQKDIM